MPSSWSHLLLAQLLIFLEELLNLHPFVCSPLYQTKLSVSDSFKIWDPPHSTLESSVMLSTATLKVFSSCSSKLGTIPHLRVSSSELLLPRSKLRNQVVTRHSSCRVYFLQPSTTTVVWVGVKYHCRTKLLQYTRWQSCDCPTDHTRCQTRDENAHRVTARGL